MLIVVDRVVAACNVLAPTADDDVDRCDNEDDDVDGDVDEAAITSHS